MDAEIVFTGLASFLNVSGQDNTMTEPSVILVRTDDHADHVMNMDAMGEMGGTIGLTSAVANGSSGTSAGTTVNTTVSTVTTSAASSVSTTVSVSVTTSPSSSDSDSSSGGSPRGPVAADPAPVPPDAVSLVHIPFIAFNTATVTVVDVATGQEPAEMTPVNGAPASKFLRLAGAAPLPTAVLIEIVGDTPGLPTVDVSYANVVRKDDYWPQAKDEWNRDFVPAPGVNGKPSSSGVVAFLRFGKGRISADRICPFRWHFDIPGGGVHEGNFAEEVVYSGFTHPDNHVDITLKDLDTEQVVRTLRFSPVVADQKVTIFIGNNVEEDMSNSVHRLSPRIIDTTGKSGHHFAFLNRVASLKTPGPTPTVFAMPHLPATPIPGTGSGSVGGACGPNNSGGPPPP
jgi:hypothetical protein